MATYLALTTLNYRQNGYHVVVEGSNKQSVRQEAEDKIVGNQANWPKDIETDTKLKNLVVVSKTDAKRRFGIDIDSTDYIEQKLAAEQWETAHFG